MNRKPEWTQRVLRALETEGPMTSAEACVMFGLTRQQGAAVFSRLLKPTKRPVEGPKRVHICDWRFDQEGQRDYPRAVYALGDKPNVKKPKRNVSAVRRRYRANRKGRLMNSVFNVGLTRAQREAMRSHAQEVSEPQAAR